MQGAEGWVCPDKRRGSHPPASYFIHPALLCTAGSRRRSASGTRVRATVSGCRHRTAKRYSAGACCRCSSSHPPPPLPPRSPQRSRPAACSSTLASGTPPRALSAPRAESLICPSLPSHRRVGSSTAAATSHILAATVGGRSTRAPRRTTWLPCPPPQRGASPRGEQRWRACEGGRLEEPPPPPPAPSPPHTPEPVSILPGPQRNGGAARGGSGDRRGAATEPR